MPAVPAGKHENSNSVGYRTKLMLFLGGYSIKQWKLLQDSRAGQYLNTGFQTLHLGNHKDFD